MALTYGFYDSLNHDRLYNAQQMSAIFDGIINDGVFMSVGNQLHTVAGSGMQVIVKSGRAWFNSTWTLNDQEYPLTISAADVLLTRIDAVVLEVNSEQATRANSLKIVKGTPASTPAKPTLTNTSTVHQHALAYVTVAKNTSAITNSMIEIVVGKTETPYVTAILQTTDITDLFNQWQDQFTVWFETVKGTLDGDVALNLQNQIDHCVKKADKATSADIEAGTADKWIDAKNVKKEFDDLIKIGDIIPTSRMLINENYIYCNGDTIPYIGHKNFYDNVKGYYNKSLSLVISMTEYGSNIYLPKYADEKYDPSTYSALSNNVYDSSSAYYIKTSNIYMNKNNGDVYYIVTVNLPKTSEDSNITWAIVIYKKKYNSDVFVYDWCYSMSYYAMYNTSFTIMTIANGLLMASISSDSYYNLIVLDLYNHTGKGTTSLSFQKDGGSGNITATSLIDDDSYIYSMGRHFIYVKRNNEAVPTVKFGYGNYRENRTHCHYSEYYNGDLYTVLQYSPSGSYETSSLTKYKVVEIVSQMSSNSFVEVTESSSTLSLNTKSEYWQPAKLLKYNDGIYYCDGHSIYLVGGNDSIGAGSQDNKIGDCLPIVYIFNKDGIYYGLYWRNDYSYSNSQVITYNNGIVKIGETLTVENIRNSRKNIISQGDTSVVLPQNSEIYMYDDILFFNTISYDSPYNENTTFFGQKTPISNELLNYFMKIK